MTSKLKTNTKMLNVNMVVPVEKNILATPHFSPISNRSMAERYFFV